MMDKEKDPSRNRPTEKGRRNDPNVRDYTAFQPGVQTNSSSEHDEDNQQVTHSAMDDSTLRDFDTDTKADATFDEIDRTKEDK